MERLPAILAGELRALPQDDATATYAGKIGSADAELDWALPAVDLERAVRAYNPVPGAWFMLDDERIKCWRAMAVSATDEPPGTMIDTGGVDFTVACGSGALRLDEVQRPGKRTVRGREFAAQLGGGSRALRRQ